MSRTRLCLQNLPQDIREEELKKYLECFGLVISFKFGHDKSHAFVRYESEEDAQDLCRTAKRHRLMGADINVEYACSRPRERYPVLVSNIPKELCWQQLKDFGRLAGGLVAYCDIDRSQRTRGFIEYWSMDEALDAIRKLDGHDLGGQPVSLSADFHATKRHQILPSCVSTTPRRRSPSSSRPRHRSPYQLHHAQVLDVRQLEGTRRQSMSRRAPRRSVSPWSRRRDSGDTLASEVGHEISGTLRSSYLSASTRLSTAYHNPYLHNSSSLRRSADTARASVDKHFLPRDSRTTTRGYASVNSLPSGHDEHKALGPYDDGAYTNLYRGTHGRHRALDQDYGYIDPYTYEQRLTPSWEDFYRSHAYLT
ncbi:hypothetical protein BD626DRAFT_626393 [Schizophyllum amplum]|uniref:RRM domain-containing protein n=1 Tax=Schizophyllum amplum TaxID=97359 RepID=A0A550CTB8_9AGAR|nr:hypothetical protein BD626DRAFT_626393 [Auriculariopsis ampla]